MRPIHRKRGTCRADGCDNPVKPYKNPTSGKSQLKSYCSHECVEKTRHEQMDPGRKALVDKLRLKIGMGAYQRHLNTALVVDSILTGLQIHPKDNLTDDPHVTCWYCGRVNGPDTHYEGCTA